MKVKLTRKIFIDILEKSGYEIDLLRVDHPDWKDKTPYKHPYPRHNIVTYNVGKNKFEHVVHHSRYVNVSVYYYCNLWALDRDKDLERRNKQIEEAAVRLENTPATDNYTEKFNINKAVRMRKDQIESRVLVKSIFRIRRDTLNFFEDEPKVVAYKQKKAEEVVEEARINARKLLVNKQNKMIKDKLKLKKLNEKYPEVLGKKI